MENKEFGWKPINQNVFKELDNIFKDVKDINISYVLLDYIVRNLNVDTHILRLQYNELQRKEDKRRCKKLKESAKHLGFVFDCRRLNTKEL